MNDLTPAESEAVRRLLADARSDEQMPPEVAARLDGVIAGLAADRTDPVAATTDSPDDAPGDAPDEGAQVVPLRRRRWPQVLVAAAAVTAIAMAGTQLLGSTSDQDNASPASEGQDVTTPRESGQRDGLADAPSPYDRGGQSSSDNGPATAPEEPGAALRGLQPADAAELGGAMERLGVSRLTPLPLEADALVTTLAELTNRSAAQEYATDDRNAVSGTVGKAPECGPLYTVDGARFFAARYRGHVALVLAHPDVSGLRLVEVYDCQGRTPRRSAELVTLVAGE